ncbi:MAG: TraR/DksA C4-type zinc finger protein [Deltaproteobacteria bacterium]|nr:TraR/DksA C4-type zinc finger protein [Deltaproteobacteria bacterium]
MLSNRKKEYIRKILQEKWDGLLSGKTPASNHCSIHIETAPDPMDRAASESERNRNLVLLERESRILRQIRHTLERIDDGTYGICEDCGEDIDEARLEIVPEARLCIQCKKRQEVI